MNLLEPNVDTNPKRSITESVSVVGFLVVSVALLFVAGTQLPSPTPPRQLPHSGPRDSVRVISQVSKPFPISRPMVPLAKDSKTLEATFTADEVLVVDDKTSVVLFKKNVTKPHPLASITKLMSALVINDKKLNWASTTIVQSRDLDGSSHHLAAGDTLTLEQLWNIALVGSDNNAIKILSRLSGYTPDAFAAAMNAKAKQLGLTSAQFVEPTGLDSRNMASAMDVARLLQAALDVPRIHNTLALGEYDVGKQGKSSKRRVYSTNWLLTNWVPSGFAHGSAIGKTGYIVDSGYNFTVRLTDTTGHAIRVVVLGANSNEARFSEARDVGQLVLAHFSWPGDEGYSALREKSLASIASQTN